MLEDTLLEGADIPWTSSAVVDSQVHHTQRPIHTSTYSDMICNSKICNREITYSMQGIYTRVPSTACITPSPPNRNKFLGRSQYVHESLQYHASDHPPHGLYKHSRH